MPNSQASVYEHARRAAWLERSSVRATLWTLLSITLSTTAAWVLQKHLRPEDIVLMYLIGAIGVASRSTVLESILSAVAHASVFDFIFIPPVFAFTVPDLKNGTIMFAMCLAAAALSSSRQRLRSLERHATFKAHAASTMYLLVHELGQTSSMEQIGVVTCRNIERVTGGYAQIVGAGAHGPDVSAARLSQDEQIAVREAWSSIESVTRRSRNTLSTIATPIVAARSVVGVLVVRELEFRPEAEPEIVPLVEQCAREAGTAIERATLQQETQRALMTIEAEQMRNTLLSAASQDLRTPLAVIKAAGETLVAGGPGSSSKQVVELARSIVRESDRVMLLVQNVLSLIRFEAGAIPLRKTDVGVDDLISVALRRLGFDWSNRRIVTAFPPDTGLVRVDSALVELVVANVLDNALKFAPDDTPVRIAITEDENAVVIEVSDEGPGIRAEEETRLFEKFVRGSAASGKEGGLGLGLSICRAVLAAHGGSMRLVNRAEGQGAVASIRLPAAPRRPIPDDPPVRSEGSLHAR